MKELLPKLAARLQPLHEEARKLEVPKFTIQVPEEDNDVISHTWFWPRVGQFFKPRDVIVSETGTLRPGLVC
jgi:pyruvate decarboxylase